jgi:hypothetical protein
VMAAGDSEKFIMLLIEKTQYPIRPESYENVKTAHAARHPVYTLLYRLKHILPQHSNIFNDGFLPIILQDCNFSKVQHKLPDDGPDGPKHVGAHKEIF